MRIVPTSNPRRAIDRLVARRHRNPGVVRRVARIVSDVRGAVTSRCEWSRRLDGLDGAIEVARTRTAARSGAIRRAMPAGDRDPAAGDVGGGGSPDSARFIARVRSRRRRWSSGVPLEARGLLCPRRPHPARVDADHDGRPRTRSRSAEIMVVCARAHAGNLLRRARGRRRPACCGSAARRRLRRWHMAQIHAARGQDRRPRKRVGRGGKALVSRDCAVEFDAGPSEIVVIGRIEDGRSGSRRT